MTQTVAIITSITCITGIGNLLAGLLTVCIPLWPTAAFALACGCVLLPCGAAADVLGCRRACLLGGLLQTASALGAGLTATGTQLIALAVGVSAHRGWWSAGEGILARLHRDIDWVGTLLISACLALLSYELAVATGSDADQSMRRPLNLVLHCSALALILVFALWMRRQVRLSRPALIPNSLWTNVPFMALCITVFLVWGTLNASEQLTALYLQDVRGTSTLTASLYFMPAPVCGLLKPSIAVPAGYLASGIAPLLLAILCGVDGLGYWRGVFQAMALNPVGADLIYTIANLVMTDSFPVKTQELAGVFFNMLAQVGKGVGIATSTLIAPVSFWGLRSVERLEIKRD
ncbi:hypothetical protein BDV37DRAFT_268533 [Aspergillus pseudonomiae]|uniref:Major facilitator superfamily domain-containing protein n=1 Tax=Aspergillus pseudonomiae TaxID=1506151 RepID=A0A5N7DR78_9EURO|nr:uncharacterized protein BDV37DRAFT_268533 [Aspergillus pseudonomiae]KAE8408543.1 hypothetical protein BDV37DRAFT_268533 [Aspergillus pseudonomiae]